MRIARIQYQFSSSDTLRALQMIGELYPVIILRQFTYHSEPTSFLIDFPTSQLAGK